MRGRGTIGRRPNGIAAERLASAFQCRENGDMRERAGRPIYYTLALSQRANGNWRKSPKWGGLLQ